MNDGFSVLKVVLDEIEIGLQRPEIPEFLFGCRSPGRVSLASVVLGWIEAGCRGLVGRKGKGKEKERRGENSSIFFLNFRQKILLVISIFTTMDGMQIKIYFVNYVCLWFLINVQNYEAHKSNCLSLYLQIGSRRVG